MSSYLWKAYYEDDVDEFRRLLEATAPANRSTGLKGGSGFAVGSPGGLGTSPTLLSKARKVSGQVVANAGGLTRAEVNWKDANGLTLLHHAASSVLESALDFATALVEHPQIDLYLQDVESGWTALHRAFYFGNVAIARLILEREADDMLGRTTGIAHQTIGLIKTKDREGLGPLDLYAATIKDRTLRPDLGRMRADSDESEVAAPDHDRENTALRSKIEYASVKGDEVFTFGSNRNVTLGFGDEDNRHFPERINLRRPEQLLRRFYREHLVESGSKLASHDASHEPDMTIAANAPIAEIPWVMRTRPLIIQDVFMSKLHSAVLTGDPESNLFVCGHGQGGRLGVGDERTRYHFACVDGGALAGKRIASVALGQNHTLAVTDEGEIFSWGNNGFGQLGYSLPRTTSSDEDPISVFPRQIFGPLKREAITGIAASRVHSVAFTGSSLFTFGKNEGQLGIVDSDARSLEVQVTPRRVAASLFTSSIASVTAIDRATVCLLANRDVWVFASYGYVKVSFPLEGFSNYFLKQSFLVTSYDNAPNRIVKVASGGDTICALSSRGEIFTMSVIQRTESAAASTTNPAKIRNAVSPPQCIWSLKKDSMAARDVSVDADGSVILTTEEGSVWQRTKRAKIKDATAAARSDYKPKDYKFSRVPGLTRVLAVRSSAYGAYAAVRRDCDVTKTQVAVEQSSLLEDVAALCAMYELVTPAADCEEDTDKPRFWQPAMKDKAVQALARAIAGSKDAEADLSIICERALENESAKYDAMLTTTTSELKIPVHRFLLTGRSRILRRGIRDLCPTSTFTIPDLTVAELDEDGRVVLQFQGVDILTIIDFAMYLYTDALVDFWHIRNAKHLAFRYRQVRTELMKLASKLDLVKLEPAVRQMVEVQPCLSLDLEMAYKDPVFYFDGDMIIQLEDDERRAHSVMLSARCPFFEGLFQGRAGGKWLEGRDEEEETHVDLSHIASRTFDMVLRHIYADTGAEIFDDIMATSLDEYLDVVLDVLSAANELMLDRLSQICQAEIGRYANARNICWLLNAISPSSVHEFKHAGLEYLCLNLEAMLQGHHLNELDEDLLQELDEVVRQNQLACMPFAKSGRAERDLRERHPELAATVQRNKQTRVDAIRLRTKHHDMETVHAGSYDDHSSPLQLKTRRRPSGISKATSEAPVLKAKASSKDMMFSMDELAEQAAVSPSPSPAIRPIASPRLSAIGSSPTPDEQWFDSRGKALTSPVLRPQQGTTPDSATPRTPKSPTLRGKQPQSSGQPWSATPLAGSRHTDLRDIMAQASSTRTSSLSQGLADAKHQDAHFSPFALPPARMSQKDRKKIQQQQNIAPPPLVVAPEPDPASSAASKSSPWHVVSGQRVPSLREMLDSPKATAPAAKTPPTTRASSTPQLTMRQTVANPKPLTPTQKPIIGPAGTHPSRSISGTPSKPVNSPPQPGLSSSAFPTLQNSKPIPHSVRHGQMSAEASLLFSMQDILDQQQLEKDAIKEAAAKRDLQEIQAEQEFQEWWDKESRRIQEAEAGPSAPAKNARGKGGRGRGGAAMGARGSSRGERDRGAGRGSLRGRPEGKTGPSYL
ncbi:hypothetical protein B0A48_01505 [Cryoendolithus antarcticus]|uniref:BTB domain-containing protein n=1 Tax=Cryoendolithus antarcticus TaxID=1507870 RepID=A0A1V8TPH4_9PEZI|nr:hypothetical protein B0A48_01505 [Cryoendolithus antarcticus]